MVKETGKRHDRCPLTPAWRTNLDALHGEEERVRGTSLAAIAKSPKLGDQMDLLHAVFDVLVERSEDFGPAAIHKALDDRDGVTNRKREQIYKTFSEYAAHASPAGTLMIAPRSAKARMDKDSGQLRSNTPKKGDAP